MKLHKHIIMMSLICANSLSSHRPSFKPSVNQTSAPWAQRSWPTMFSSFCQHEHLLSPQLVYSTPHRQLTGLPMNRPPPTCSLSRLVPALCGAVPLSGHVRTVAYKAQIKGSQACALLSSRALLCGIWHTPGQPDFLKLPCRIRIRVWRSLGALGSSTLFTLFPYCVIVSVMKHSSELQLVLFTSKSTSVQQIHNFIYFICLWEFNSLMWLSFNFDQLLQYVSEY